MKNGKDPRLWKGQHANALGPTWLLAEPIKLTSNKVGPLAPAPFASIRLRLLAGPQRLEAAGWGGSPGALRDYFLARGEDTGLLWIYRNRLGAAHAEPPDWYWHGLFA